MHQDVTTAAQMLYIVKLCYQASSDVIRGWAYSDLRYLAVVEPGRRTWAAGLASPGSNCI